MNDANLGNLKVLCIGTEKNQKIFLNFALRQTRLFMVCFQKRT